MKIIWEDIPFEDEKLIEAMKGEDFEENGMDTTMFQGPFGPESMLDPMSFSKRHPLIMGHCDFNISKRRGLVIMKTRGVDFLKVTTRYSFLMSVGKAFDKKDVMADIERVMCDSIVELTPDDIEELIAELEGNGKYCIYHRDDIIHTITEEDPAFDTYVLLYKESQQKHGGTIYEG